MLLKLSEFGFDQQKTIEPLINDIIDIKDQADKTRNKMRSNMQSMGTPLSINARKNDEGTFCKTE